MNKIYLLTFIEGPMMERCTGIIAAFPTEKRAYYYADMLNKYWRQQKPQKIEKTLKHCLGVKYPTAFMGGINPDYGVESTNLFGE